MDLENTKESILPVCDKPYHKIKENMPHAEELENLWNYPVRSVKIFDTFLASESEIQTPLLLHQFYAFKGITHWGRGETFMVGNRTMPWFSVEF